MYYNNYYYQYKFFGISCDSLPNKDFRWNEPVGKKRQGVPLITTADLISKVKRRKTFQTKSTGKAVLTNAVSGLLPSLTDFERNGDNTFQDHMRLTVAWLS